MQLMLLTLVVLLAIVLMMSVGVLMGRKPIAGSCGGMSAIGLETECDICGGNKEICETEQQKRQTVSTDLGYDASSQR
ncbi:hypothetical protein SAMN05421831_101141 [Allopseudospirillum japonicum]|uniref:ApbE family protein n=1 Tax=Allopseudospirillum japonicum TaxID=64971 RepID=A0A1H6Q914_9GAMM|nr:(Na+)-NQR maturation NqrM [Allopseudospirillum japonicum]SEI38336.1 hypothetical protein SAMN05421831_101141 [Allopseudospirillum japonicum]